jgi:glycosyltransferase involved in cell wall biosynthesis
LRNPICIIPNAIDLPGQIDHGTTGQRTTGLQDYETTRPQTPDPRPVSSQLSVVGSPSPAVRNRRSVVSSLKSDGRKVLLYLGRIHPKKGLVNLLKAWAKNRKSEIRNQKSEEWVLAIAGWDQGGHELELKRLCDELGIAWGDVRKGGTTGQQDNVTTALRSVVSGQWSVVFLGPQFGDAKAACYQNCDAFILPSFSEGLPMVILEAWAYGKPVLMTTQCNLPEGFAAGAAICVEPNAESLAQGLYTLFQSSISDLQSTGSRGRALVAARFNWARCAREMVEVYRWLLGSGTKPSVVI